MSSDFRPVFEPDTEEDLDDAIVKVWEMPEPPPQHWLVPGMIPKGAITMLYADGGEGKSTVATYVALCLAKGLIPFGLSGPAPRRVPTLYVDAETDLPPFLERVHKLTRGLGLQGVPQDIYFHRLRGSICDPKNRETVARAIHEYGIGLTILDSLSIATHGTVDVNESNVIIEMMTKIEQEWGTVLAIDHVGKQTFGAHGKPKPFGSNFKYIIARSAFKLSNSGGVTTLTQTKSNYGAMIDKINLRVAHHADRIEVSSASPEDVKRAAGDSASDESRILGLMESEPGRAWTPKDIEGALGIDNKTVGNRCRDLLRKNRLTQPKRGLYQIAATKSDSEV